MQPVSYARHPFPPELIRHAVWLYLRFTLSYRDVEDLVAERGLDLSYETAWRWVNKFGPKFARNLRRLRLGPSDTWTRWWSRSRAGACTSGEPSAVKARCSTCWFSPSGTQRQHPAGITLR